MIFRAMCSGYSHEFPDRRQDETVVYIDAANRDEARQRFPELLATVWQLPAGSIEVWNLESEFQLQADPFAAGLTPDQALFVIGGSGKMGPSYVRAEIGHPLFLLSKSLNRVMQAYLSLHSSAS